MAEDQRPCWGVEFKFRESSSGPQGTCEPKKNLSAFQAKIVFSRRWDRGSRTTQPVSQETWGTHSQVLVNMWAHFPDGLWMKLVDHKNKSQDSSPASLLSINEPGSAVIDPHPLGRYGKSDCGRAIPMHLRLSRLISPELALNFKILLMVPNIFVWKGQPSGGFSERLFSHPVNTRLKRPRAGSCPESLNRVGTRSDHWKSPAGADPSPSREPERHSVGRVPSKVSLLVCLLTGCHPEKWTDGQHPELRVPEGIWSFTQGDQSCGLHLSPSFLCSGTPSPSPVPGGGVSGSDFLLGKVKKAHKQGSSGVGVKCPSNRWTLQVDICKSAKSQNRFQKWFPKCKIICQHTWKLHKNSLYCFNK